MNNFKRIILLPIVLLFFVTIIASYIFFDQTKLHHITYQNTTQASTNKAPSNRILIINTQKAVGGGEIYTLSLYKNLTKRGRNASILIRKGSWLENKLKKERLPYYAAKTFKLKFVSNLKKICTQESIDIIHCNVEREVLPSMQAAHNTKTRVVFSRHLPKTQLIFKPEIMSNIDGVVCVSTEIERDTYEENTNKNLCIKNITRIAPFFEQKQFENVISDEPRQDYFKQRFGIEIGSTKTGVTNIIIDKQTGLLFENNNAHDLVEKIEALLDNPSYAQQLGENAHKYVLKNFSTNITINQLEMFYDKVLNS